MAPPEDTFLGPSEWLIMRCLWDLGRANSVELAEHAATVYGREMSANTAATFLSRLVHKGYAAFYVPEPNQQRGRPAHVYVPTEKREEHVVRQFGKWRDNYLLDESDLRLVQAALEAELGKGKKRGF